MRSLKNVDYLADRLGITVPQAYKLIREEVIDHDVAPRVGRQIRINDEVLEERIANGGFHFAGGWRKDGGDAEASG